MTGCQKVYLMTAGSYFSPGTSGKKVIDLFLRDPDGTPCLSAFQPGAVRTGGTEENPTKT